MPSTITFVGHFDIGERLTTATKTLIEEAKRLNGDYLVLVGDIGVDIKLIDFLKGGVSNLIAAYQTRYECANSICIRTQIPSTQKAAAALIDESHYNAIAKALQQQAQGIWSVLKADKNLPKTHIADYRQFIHKFIKSCLIPQRMEHYGFHKDKLQLFSERNLRNRVGQRLKKSRKKNWYSFLHPSQVLNQNGNPICRGIMFALFEKVAELGYEEIQFLVETRHQRAVLQGWTFFKSRQQSIPYLNSNLKAIRFDTEQILCLKQNKTLLG